MRRRSAGACWRELRGRPRAHGEAAKLFVGKGQNLQSGSSTLCKKLTDKAAKHLAEKRHCLQGPSFGAAASSLTRPPSTSRGAARTCRRHPAEYCKSLRSAGFNRGDKLTDETVKQLSEKCESLTSVAFERCDKPTEEAAKHLTEKCQSLRSVGLA